MAKSGNKEKALAALIETNSVRDAAKKCGLSEPTLFRYLRDSEFRTEFREHRRSLMEATVGRLQQVSDKATETLDRNLNCGNHAVEVRAAAIVLEHSIKAIEIADLMERIEALENADSK